MKIGLIVIDGQKDFVEGGNLAVTGGNAALSRIAKMIKRVKGDLFSVDCTMDAHHRHHIGHSRMWVNSKGENPPPFITQMRPDDVIGMGAIWRAANPAWQARQQRYIEELSKRNDAREALGLLRIEHTIWTDHCLIGTDGMSLQADLYAAVSEWEDYKNRPANKTTKGSYIFAEHFSVFKAEVPEPSEPMTNVNMPLITELSKLDMLAWGGLAEEYCLMNSFIDFILTLSGNDATIAAQIAKKMVFLEDGTAPVGAVPSFKQAFHDFLTKWNVKIETTDSFLK
jgi:nicotinamidase-related amidase